MCASNHTVFEIFIRIWRPFWILASQKFSPHFWEGHQSLFFIYTLYMINPSRNLPTHSTVTELSEMTQLHCHCGAPACFPSIDSHSTLPLVKRVTWLFAQWCIMTLGEYSPSWYMTNKVDIVYNTETAREASHEYQWLQQTTTLCVSRQVPLHASQTRVAEITEHFVFRAFVWRQSYNANNFIWGWFSLEKLTYINTLKAYDYMKARFCWSLHDWFGLGLIHYSAFSAAKAM